MKKKICCVIVIGTPHTCYAVSPLKADSMARPFHR